MISLFESPRRSSPTRTRVALLGLLLAVGIFDSLAAAGPITERIGRRAYARQSAQTSASPGVIRTSVGQTPHTSILQKLKNRLQAKPSPAPKPFSMPKTSRDLTAGTMRR